MIKILTLIILFYHIVAMIFVIFKFLSIGKLKIRSAKYKRVSILIPARNEEENLPKLLNSLIDLNYENYEVLVYDDLSEDRTYEVAKRFENEKIKVIKGNNKPTGWIGKNYALFNLVNYASGDILLFLDADVIIKDKDILRKISSIIENNVIITGFGKIEGSGRSVLSVIPFLFSQFPLNAGVNGQFWAILKEDYRKYNLHFIFRDEVLEDVKIGFFLFFKGFKIKFYDLTSVFSVSMYKNISDFIEGLTKNSFSFFGKKLTPIAVSLYFVFFLLPFLFIFKRDFFVISCIILINKLLSDIKHGFSILHTILAPFEILVFGAIILRSWFFAIRREIYWKGRKIYLYSL
ncbi:MAG: glycosyltransferase [candidate division WOR-3 bacterium]|nr:glycosyltransferase [candidate division WOR-3 bacterium]MCX7948404.1 glycosyltransferase [candidate division WOR-3 bacterium]MDW8150384.1 glycosyltransferase [candidate division WOR-3 bacterium]